MRANSTISIYNAGGTEIIPVPITPASRRRWKLMEEDSVTLSFNHDSSIDFNIGDYIVDEIFGKFVITDDPVPADYDPIAGAYKYTLRFDADWIGWKNKVFMLTYNGVRKETTWDLTDILENHLAVVLQNLTALGYTGYDKSVENTVEDPNKAVHVTYSGTTILDALKTLADAYQCEFWVTDKVIHFGKCEAGDPIPFSMSDEGGRTINVENMIPNRNESEYGNRFWVYGSTKNLPETYRKHLTFKADTLDTSGSYAKFKDSIRPLSPEMFTPRVVQSETTTIVQYDAGWGDYSYREMVVQNLPYIQVIKTTGVIPVVQGWGLAFSLVVPTWYVNYIFELVGEDGLVLDTRDHVSGGTFTIPEGVEKVTVRFTYDYFASMSGQAVMPNITITENTENGYFATLTYQSGGQAQMLDVRLVEGFLAIVTSRPYTYAATIPFAQNTEFTLSEGAPDGLNILKVPFSYFTDDGDELGNQRMLGERRLMLPQSPFTSLSQAVINDIENGYVQRGTLTKDEIVERVVYFEEIYPRCALRVTHVDVGAYDNDTTYSDGSKKVQILPAYVLQAARIDGADDVDFPFDPKTMMVVGKLTATFLTPDETKAYSHKSTENACSLMGMTFDVACNRANGVTTYQLAWNDEYGDKLPNEILKPEVGDAFILAGWNPVAMATLGLILSAENELANTADEYAELVREAQFTFDCSMMSDWIQNRCSYSNGHYQPDGLLPMGQKVSIHHSSLSQDFVSRVIGFEYKLDIPYDTPIYTIGETEAYSRLKEIEKSLHAQSQSTSSSSNTSSSSLSGGGASESTGKGQPLHLVTGPMDGISSVDYNGSEEATMRVPSVVDHLVDSVIVPRIGETSGGITTLVDKEGTPLQLGSFFEIYEDTTTTPHTFSVKLKDTIGGNSIAGLWASGWIADGGIGDDDSGGLITAVKGIADLGTPITTESLTETFSAKAIQSIYDAVLALQNSPYTLPAATASALGGVKVGSVISTPTLQTITSTSGRYYQIQCDSAGKAFVNVPWVQGIPYGAVLMTNNTFATNNRLYITKIDNNLYAAASRFVVTHKYYDSTNDTLLGDVPNPEKLFNGNYEVYNKLTKNGTYGELYIGKVAEADLGSTSSYMWLYGGGEIYICFYSTWAPDGITAKVYSRAYSSSQAEGWYDMTVTQVSTSVYKLTYGSKGSYYPVAYKIKYIGKTYGTYGASICEVEMSRQRAAIEDQAAIVKYPINQEMFGELTAPKFIKKGGTSSQFLKANGSVDSNTYALASALADYVTLAGAQTITGGKTFAENIKIAAKNITFRDASDQNTYASIQAGSGYLQLTAGNGHYMLYPDNGLFFNGGGVPCGRSDHRWSGIYAVDADLTGNLSMASNKHIDIGPVRIEYDATNKAIHITKVDANDTNNYGIYADGFVGDGGILQTS